MLVKLIKYGHSSNSADQESSFLTCKPADKYGRAFLTVLLDVLDADRVFFILVPLLPRQIVHLNPYSRKSWDVD